jgi:HK97 gp10 family phage protein
MIRLSLEGIDDADLTILRLAGRAGVIAERMAKAGALPIHADAVQLAPVRTGNLRRSIHIEAHETTATSASVLVGTRERYAVYQEFGTGVYAEGGDGRQTPWVYTAGDGRAVWTRGNRPHPFLRPAFDNNRDTALMSMRRAISQEIDHARRSRI